MWTTLGLIAALSLAPAQPAGAGSLDLINIRATYGYLGGTRPDNKLLPGDIYFVAFDITNLKVTDTGEVSYSMGMELTDTNKKVWYKQDPQKLKVTVGLGGNQLPAFAHVIVGFDQPPGRYALTLTVTDLAANSSKSFTREFEVTPLGFGLVRVNLSGGPEGPPAPHVGVTGQSVWVNFAAVGFELNPQKLPNLAVEMVIVDDATGKPTLPKPMVGTVKQKEEVQEGKVVPMQFFLALNRPGSFTVRLKATDNLSKKTAEVAFPIKVIEPK